ncbi:MAG TPA: hypothetical protein VF765_03685 [Polyangiaceae bacterium]
MAEVLRRVGARGATTNGLVSRLGGEIFESLAFYGQPALDAGDDVEPESGYLDRRRLRRVERASRDPSSDEPGNEGEWYPH